MNDCEGLIDGINEKPHDLMLRVVYADWLEEQGDPAANVWRWLAAKRFVPELEVCRGEYFSGWWCTFGFFTAGDQAYGYVPSSLWDPLIPYRLIVSGQFKGYRTAVSAIAAIADVCLAGKTIPDLTSEPF